MTIEKGILNGYAKKEGKKNTNKASEGFEREHFEKQLLR